MRPRGSIESFDAEVGGGRVAAVVGALVAVIAANGTAAADWVWFVVVVFSLSILIKLVSQSGYGINFGLFSLAKLT